MGVRVLPHVAPAIAAGLARRNEKNGPLNVILCENHPEADTLLQEAVTTIDPQVATAAGFVRASIGRMVPVVSERNRGNDPLMVWAEPYARLPVDRDGIRGSLPDIPGLEPSSPFSFEIDKKLLLHNMTHAVAAYLGARSGYHCIWEALADAGIRRQVCAAGKSISRALAAEYEKPIRSIQKYARELVTRYRNQALGDTVDRVGRDPERKLGPADRLIGAAKLCAKHGIRMESIASACLAAVEFGSRSGSIATALERGGLEAVLSDVCGLTPEDEVAKAILHAAGEPQ